MRFGDPGKLSEAAPEKRDTAEKELNNLLIEWALNTGQSRSFFP